VQNSDQKGESREILNTQTNYTKSTPKQNYVEFTESVSPAHQSPRGEGGCSMDRPEIYSENRKYGMDIPSDIDGLLADNRRARLERITFKQRGDFERSEEIHGHYSERTGTVPSDLPTRATTDYLPFSTNPENHHELSHTPDGTIQHNKFMKMVEKQIQTLNKINFRYQTEKEILEAMVPYMKAYVTISKQDYKTLLLTENSEDIVEFAQELFRIFFSLVKLLNVNIAVVHNIQLREKITKYAHDIKRYNEMLMLAMTMFWQDPSKIGLVIQMFGTVIIETRELLKQIIEDLKQYK